MTNEEARKFGLNLLHGIMERNKSYPVYADNVRQAIEALSAGSSEKPNNHLEGLDEAAIDGADKLLAQPKDYALNAKADYWNGAHDGFKAGAEWQAEQLLKSSPLPEDTVLFNKGVEEGKRLMMEEAVEGFIFQSADYYPKQLIAGYDGELGMGDKVRIIIVKEDWK